MDNPFVRIETYFWPLAAAGAGLIAGMAARRVVLPLVARAASRSSWKYDDALVEAARNPVVLWGALGGLFLGTRILPFSPGTRGTLATTFLVLGILSVTWFLARFAGLALRVRAAAGAQAGVSLIANVVRAAVFVTGILIILQTLGIAITPIITALGVGGLAVGLALQDTLGNFFAGVRILAAGRVRPGDFIKLDSGEEGYVLDITWAQTTVRQLPNSVVIVPNAKLVGATVTNYDLPDTEQAFVVPVGVAYGSDLERVERVTVEVARQVQETVAGGVPTFEPVVRFHTFADSSVNLNVVMRARHYTERPLLIHEFVKRLHARYAQDGIEIPFPQRVVHAPPA